MADEQSAATTATKGHLPVRPVSILQLSTDAQNTKKARRGRNKLILQNRGLSDSDEESDASQTTRSRSRTPTGSSDKRSDSGRSAPTLPLTTTTQKTMFQAAAQDSGAGHSGNNAAPSTSATTPRTEDTTAAVRIGADDDSTSLDERLRRLRLLEAERQLLIDDLQKTCNIDMTDTTEFILPKKSAKPKPSAPPSGITTSNRFGELTTEDTHMDTQEIECTETERPTTNRQATSNKQMSANRQRVKTLHIDNKELKDPRLLLNDFAKITPHGFTARNTRDELIIQPTTQENYEKLLDRLDNLRLDNTNILSRQIHYHHHRIVTQPREKLVIKGLSPNIPPQDITTELETQNIHIHHVSEMKKRQDDQTLKGLGLYVIEVDKTAATNIRQNLTQLFYHKIRIETYHETDRVPQCTNCQRLHHTRQYCHRLTVCAKCSLNHKTTDCNNPDVKCANCRQDHPAYWPTCPIILKARQERLTLLTRLRTRQTPQETRQTPNASSTTDFPNLPTRPSTIIPNIPTQSFANIINGTPSSTSASPSSSTDSTFSDLKDLINLLKNCDLKKILATAKEIITIFKGPGDGITKIMTVLTKVCDLF